MRIVIVCDSNNFEQLSKNKFREVPINYKIINNDPIGNGTMGNDLIKKLNIIRCPNFLIKLLVYEHNKKTNVTVERVIQKIIYFAEENEDLKPGYIFEHGNTSKPSEINKSLCDELNLNDPLNSDLITKETLGKKISQFLNKKYAGKKLFNSICEKSKNNETEKNHHPHNKFEREYIDNDGTVYDIRCGPYGYYAIGQSRKGIIQYTLKEKELGPHMTPEHFKEIENNVINNINRNNANAKVKRLLLHFMCFIFFSMLISLYSQPIGSIIMYLTILFYGIKLFIMCIHTIKIVYVK